MNLFLDIVRRNEERLMSNISIATLDPLNYHPYDAHLPSYISMPFSRNALEDHRQTIGNIVLGIVYYFYPFVID